LPALLVDNIGSLIGLEKILSGVILTSSPGRGSFAALATAGEDPADQAARRAVVRILRRP
jgi:hypothetical protein